MTAQLAPTIDDDETACPRCGRDSCEGCGPQPLSRPRLGFVSADAIMKAPRPEPIIEDIAWRDCLTTLVGQPGDGKTFVALSLAAAISDGRSSWCGRAVQHGSAAYASWEGDALCLRLRALRETGHRLDNLHILRPSDPISPGRDRDGIEVPSRGEVQVAEALDDLGTRLKATGRPPVAALFIDTVRASMTGSEDNSDTAAAYLRRCRALLTHTASAACVLVHHTGWQDSDDRKRRERGSSALRGNVDATLFLEVDAYDAEHSEARITLRTLKVRDAERPAPLHLVRRRIELPECAGEDIRSGPVTSCVIEHDRRSREDRQVEETRALAAAHHDLDVLVLRMMRDHPEATSVSRLRPYVGRSTDVVNGSVTRVLRAGWVVAGKRREPFTLTALGLSTLNEGKT